MKQHHSFISRLLLFVFLLLMITACGADGTTPEEELTTPPPTVVSPTPDLDEALPTAHTSTEVDEADVAEEVVPGQDGMGLEVLTILSLGSSYEFRQDGLILFEVTDAGVLMANGLEVDLNQNYETFIAEDMGDGAFRIWYVPDIEN